VRNAYDILVGKSEKKRPLGRPSLLSNGYRRLLSQG